MDKELTCANCIETLISLQKRAQKRIIEALHEHSNFYVSKYDGKNGIGSYTSKNDRRLFVWISIVDGGKEYLIILFYNEIPLDYMEGKYTKEMCLNKKWITIDDVNYDDNVPIRITEAFEKFVVGV